MQDSPSTYTVTLTGHERLFVLSGLGPVLARQEAGTFARLVLEGACSALRAAVPDVTYAASDADDEVGPRATEIARRIWRELPESLGSIYDWTLAVSPLPRVPTDALIVRGCADDGETGAAWEVTVRRLP